MIRDNAKIDWDELRIGYNRMYNTTYPTAPDMVAGVYEELLTLQKVGDILGVSRKTVEKYMQRWDIKRYKKGHRGHSLFQDLYRGINTPDQYTPKELADMVGCSISYVYRLIDCNK